MVTRDVLPNGIRILTESIPHVRSVSIGVWLARGSRDEGDRWPGIAHFVEHMLFKGTETRTAEDIAQAMDSIGGQIDASTGKENANYSIRVLDEHVTAGFDVLSDLVLHPRFAPDDIEREKGVVLEEIKMVEDMPDDLVHEMFIQGYWKGHPLGRPILGSAESVSAISAEALREYYGGAYTSDRIIVSAAGRIAPETVRALVEQAFGGLRPGPSEAGQLPPGDTPDVLVRSKDLEQSHVCLGLGAYPQRDPDRYTGLVLNTILGGSMSSRLFQNVREKRGLAYSVGSGISSYRDGGLLSVYAGCANDKVAEVVRVVMDEMRALVATPVSGLELRRAQDNVKGGMILGLESTWHRAAYLARQEIYFDRLYEVEETLDGISRVTSGDVARVARSLMANRPFALTVLGAVDGLSFAPEELRIDL